MTVTLRKKTCHFDSIMHCKVSAVLPIDQNNGLEDVVRLYLPHDRTVEYSLDRWDLECY